MKTTTTQRACPPSPHYCNPSPSQQVSVPVHIVDAVARLQALRLAHQLLVRSQLAAPPAASFPVAQGATIQTWIPAFLPVPPTSNTCHPFTLQPLYVNPSSAAQPYTSAMDFAQQGVPQAQTQLSQPADRPLRDQIRHYLAPNEAEGRNQGAYSSKEDRSSNTALMRIIKEQPNSEGPQNKRLPHPIAPHAVDVVSSPHSLLTQAQACAQQACKKHAKVGLSKFQRRASLPQRQRKLPARNYNLRKQSTARLQQGARTPTREHSELASVCDEDQPMRGLADTARASVKTCSCLGHEGSVVIEKSDHHTEIGQTHSERSSSIDPSSSSHNDVEAIHQEALGKSQRTLLAEWLRERDYPNRALDFLPKGHGRVIQVSNHNNQIQKSNMIEPVTNLPADDHPAAVEVSKQNDHESLHEHSHEGSSDLTFRSEFSSDKNTVITRIESKTFQGVPPEWHETIQVKHLVSQRVKLYFRCRHTGCKSVFKKSCNLRDHFRKHTGQRPFTCILCQKTFTQSGNLGRHLKNVHKVPRDAQQRHLIQAAASRVTSDQKSISKGTVQKRVRRHPEQCQMAHVTHSSISELSQCTSPKPSAQPGSLNHHHTVQEETQGGLEVQANEFLPQHDISTMAVGLDPVHIVEEHQPISAVEVKACIPSTAPTVSAMPSGAQTNNTATLQLPLSLSKLNEFNEAAQHMIEEYADSALQSQLMLTPLGQSPRATEGGVPIARTTISDSVYHRFMGNMGRPQHDTQH